MKDFRGPTISAYWITLMAACAIVVGAAWWSIDNLDLLRGQTLALVLSFMLAIVLGETARLSIVGRRDTAPISTAAALALTLTSLSPGDMAMLSSSIIVAAIAVAMAIGGLVQRLRGKPFGLADAAARLVGVSVACVLYRQVPFDHRTLLEWQSTWDDRRWLVAVVMLVASSMAMLVQLLLEGAMSAQRDHASLLRTIADEVRAAFGLTTALVTTGALIGLAEYALSIVALPLFLVPLLLTQFAVRRYGSIRETYRQTIGALSSLTDRAGYTPAGHAARVAELAVAMGRDLGMPQREILELERAALLHDLGQIALREPIPGGATLLAAPADQQRIAHDGAEIVRRTGVLDTVASILEAQTSPYRQVREFGEDLPVPSRIIKVANAFDDLSGGVRGGDGESRAMERIHLGLGYEYDPRVVDSLSRVLARTSRAAAIPAS